MVKGNCIGQNKEFRVGKLILWIIHNQASVSDSN